MAIGSIINLGGGGGSLGGKGMIIVDTATMTAGDVVRVRDVFDSQNVQNKSVVTAGTPLYFEVNPYCYYKVCTVQTIDDTPTEIGGMYTTIDVGQTVYVNVLDKKTLGGVQGILNSHQEGELLAIGDEVTVKQASTDWTMQIAYINTTEHYIEFVSKYVSDNDYPMGYTYSGRNDLLSYLSTFYNILAENEKPYIKTKTCYYQESGLRSIDQKIWIPSRNEVFGDYASENNTRFPIFLTQGERIKRRNSGGNSVPWQLTSRNTQVNGYTDYVNTEGSKNYSNSSVAALPCFRLTADS